MILAAIENIYLFFLQNLCSVYECDTLYELGFFSYEVKEAQ